MKKNSVSPEYKRAYRTGYNAGSRGAWPEHRPPMPPGNKLRALVLAARELRDAADCICAVLDDDDEFVKMLAPRIDEMDYVMIAWSSWLIEKNDGDAARHPVAAPDPS